MKLRYSVLLPIIAIIMVTTVFAAQAQDVKPLIVEEGTPLQASPSSVTTPTETSTLGYKITTSENDPDCDTGFGGYLNLEDISVPLKARVGGDNFAAGPFFSYIGPIEFYGQQYQGIWITSEGFVYFSEESYGRKPWEPQILPDTEGPNGLAAMLWQDMEIVYDKEKNHGVTMGYIEQRDVMIIEFDDVRLAKAPNNRYDVEMVMRRQISHAEGAYEIVFAYDNLNGTLEGPLTIGLENAAGTSGVALVNKDSAKQVISNGFMVCFDAVNGTPPSSTPSAIQASDGTYEDKVLVTWGDVNKAANYDVYRADENGNSEIKLGSADNTRFNDTTAAAGITYTYRVKACNPFGCTNPSPHDSGWRAGSGFNKFAYIPLVSTK